MKRMALLLPLASLAACGGGDDGGGSNGSDASMSGTRDVTEVEPNDERVEATQLPAGGGTFTIHGTCANDTDLDYYDAHPLVTGPYSATLTWQAGAFEVAFDPEDGFSGAQTASMTSPVTVSGQVLATSPAPQLAVDCYNDPAPAGLAGLAYTLELSLPM